MPKATALVSGYLYSVDWATFNAKQDAITKGNLTESTSSVLTISGGTASVIGSGVSIQVKQAGTSQSGYLSSTDWNTFNNKGSGTVTSVSGTSPIASSGGATPAISIQQANTSQGGYLSSTDWNTFNNKGNGTVTSVTGTTPLVSTGGTTPAISIPQATSADDGYLSSTDWNVFNNKFNPPSGTTAEYVRGDGSLATFPTLPSIVNGNVDIDFGAGNNLATVAVHSTDVLTTSSIIVMVNGDGATASHNAYEHRMVPLKLTAGGIVDNVSFEIYATTDLLLSGSFNLKYTIS
jgi:hypothetical protein